MSDKPSDQLYIFEDFQIDPSRMRLSRLPGGETVPLTRKAFHVLWLLIENRGQLVTKDTLMAEVWKDSFVEEANLTQTISVLRKTLGESPGQHRFIVTETGMGYRFVAPVTTANGAGSGPSIVTDGPEPRPADGAASRGPSHRPIHLALLLGILVIGGYYYFFQAGTGIPPTPSRSEIRAIAVLPFKNTEADNENNVLGIGMADAVINRLSQIRTIVVRQTTSVMRYATSTPEAIQVGREINVDAVLDGNIQKADGRIRVSVRLYRVDDGSLLWAESFDEREIDIFALQDSISEKVANSLSLKLNADERGRLRRRYTENIEAYNLYNKGRFFWNNRSSEDLRKSISLYEQAIDRDPNYALAYAGMAQAYVLLHLFSRSHEKDLFPKAKQAAEQALTLDADLAEARTALALYKEQYEWDWAGAEVEFKKAIAANPNYATAHQWYGEYLAFMGRTDEAISEVERSAELDPLSLSTNTARAFPYLMARRYDDAIQKLSSALELQKDFPIALYYLARSYDGKGSYKEAIAEYKRAIEISGGSTFFSSAMIHALVKNGQRSEAEKAFAEISELARKEPVSKYVLARSLAALGDKELALERLEDAISQRDGLAIILGIDQNFDELRGDPRLGELLNRLHIP